MATRRDPSLPPTEAIHADPQARGVPRLTVTSGASAGAKLLLTKARATVGRHPTCDLVLDDPRVSSAHLEVERRGAGRVLVCDLGTTNGTWLGPHRVVELECGPGALLRVGDTSIRVELDDRARPEAGSDASQMGELLGACPEMREVFAALARVAPTEISVLIQGETGTGKDAVARTLHSGSPRAGGPLVIADAAGLPAAAAEELLFGREDPGAVERARGGTLVVDDVGELPRSVQSQLLRLLETGQFSRAGRAEALSADVRVVATTQRDLRADVEEGRFREGLYLRLAGVRVTLAPLRSRPGDVRLLALAFSRDLSRADRQVTVTEDALASLERRPWPGNVRELKNAITRAAALSATGAIEASDVDLEGFGVRRTQAEREALDLDGTFAEAKERAIDRFERAYLEALMRRAGGNISEASRVADIARNHLRALLKKRSLYEPG